MGVPVHIGGALGVSGTVSAAMEAEVHGIPGIASSIQVDISSWHTFGELDRTAAVHFTAALARQVLAVGLPPEVAVVNLDTPRGATVGTPARRTVQSRQPYYRQRVPAGARRYGEPLRLTVESVTLDRIELPGVRSRAWRQRWVPSQQC